MKLSDGKRTIEIKLQRWNGTGYDPDMSNEFFEAGSLPYDEEHDTYIVDDVDYCIDYANDWKDGKGDFDDADITHVVFVTEIEED